MTYIFEDRITALENRRFSLTQLFYSQVGAYTTITLNDRWSNYDMLVFEVCNTGGQYLKDNKVDIRHFFLCTNIVHTNNSATADNEMWDYCMNYDDVYNLPTIYFRDDRKTVYILRRQRPDTSTNYAAVISVQGIKFQ